MVVVVVMVVLEVVMVLMSGDCLRVFHCIWANGW